ncbi:MAG: haloacid dehalogenase-like hydrolase [Clostridia bacterium]|nr:haloacid dehalogenase-like hydrolase [Clostridia bacterium]
MNVYDFDNTILRGDSSARFFAWCLRRYPRMWTDLPAQAVNGLLFLLKIRPKQAFKQRMFGYLKLIDVDRAVDGFWRDNLPRVKPWYKANHRDDDVVISASPEFLIRPACDALGISRALASPVDKHTGIFHGPNCHGPEKVRRFREAFPDARVDNFYSDSHSDDPMAALADQAWMVRGDDIAPW